MIKDLSSDQLEDFLLSHCVGETGVPNNGTLWEFSNGTNVLTYEGHRHVFLWGPEMIILDKETDSLKDCSTLSFGLGGEPPKTLLCNIYDIACAIENGSIGITDRVETYLTNEPKSSRYSYNFASSSFSLHVELSQGLSLYCTLDSNTKRSTLSLSYDLITVGTIETNDTTSVHHALKILTRRFRNLKIQPLLDASLVKSDEDLQKESAEESLDDILDQVSKIPGVKTNLRKDPKDIPLTRESQNVSESEESSQVSEPTKEEYIVVKFAKTPPIDEVMRKALEDFEQ